MVNKAANRHSGDFQAGQPSSLPPFSNSPLDNIYTPPNPLQHNACKPEVPVQVELLVCVGVACCGIFPFIGGDDQVELIEGDGRL